LPDSLLRGRPSHALHLKQSFDEAGVDAEYIDCDTDRMECERIFRRFRVGEIRVIANVATTSPPRHSSAERPESTLCCPS
jgi:hypothetical protein